MKVTAYLVKAFTKDTHQGNPAGVILHADTLSDEQMITIASTLGFSESAFVQKSQKADYRVRFFTPKQEVSLCGHATIATFHILSQSIHFSSEKPVKLTQETKAGILPVFCHSDGKIMMTQGKPEFFDPEENREQIAKLLALNPDSFLSYPIQCVSTGTPKLLIPIKSLKELFSIKPDLEGIAQYCREGVVRGFYPFTMEVRDPEATFHARQFNPLAGVDEDPITGVAAGALGWYVKKYHLIKKSSFIVEQGYIMGKEGNIFVDITTNLQVGGYAISFGKKEIEVI
jgi:PhzF family phenazine biosynthesis protein